MEMVRTKGKLLARRTGPVLSTRMGSAKTVAVSGDFNGWDPIGIPLTRNEDDTWAVRLDLPPGEYQYRLLVDGDWHDHPEAARRVPNPFGGHNCVLLVQ